MMKSIVSNLFVALLALIASSGTTWALPSRVSIDISSLAGSAIELEIDLYDNSGFIGDSWALIDNVTLEPAIEIIDFETGTLEGFADWLNPVSVGVVSGDLIGGSYVLQIDEDPGVTPTITYRDFLPSTATTLSFYFEMTASNTSGPWGLDALVFSILDPVTLSPFPSLPGLYGFGDVLEVTASGVKYSPGVTVTVIPVPGALLLGMIGIGTMDIFRRFRKSV
jgi:hypothetical protein